MENARSLALLLSILVLLLLVRVFPIAPYGFDVALLACTSAPAMYALTYYRKKFVAKKGRVPPAWENELLGICMAYIFGLLVYTSLYAAGDIVTYTAAFVSVMLLRLFTAKFIHALAEQGVDVTRPIILFSVAAASALLTFAILALLLTLA